MKSWLDKYYLACHTGKENESPIEINENQLFTGNKDTATIVTHKFDPPIRCAGITLNAKKAHQNRIRKSLLCTKFEVKFYTNS